MNIFSFELRRGLSASLSPIALLSILVSTLIFIGFSYLGVLISEQTQHSSYGLAGFGFLWSSMAAINTSDRNRSAFVDDVWWAFELDTRFQNLFIFLAWGIIAYIQGIIVSQGINFAVTHEPMHKVLLQYTLGFGVAIPLGLALTSLARIFSGIYIVSGIILLIGVIFLQFVSYYISEAASISFAGGYYIIMTCSMFFICSHLKRR